MSALQLTDTHCHIHEAQYGLTGDDPTRAKWLRAGKPDPDVMITSALAAGVGQMICVGTTVDDSELAVSFVRSRKHVWAAIGIHPHEAKVYAGDSAALQRLAALAARPKVVAVGECGLDYFYEHSPKEAQERILRLQLELAQKHNLPVIFHVRDAFKDFWPIFDDYRGIRGVIHSFSATKKELQDILARGLYVGLNGIMTFTKDPAQLAAAKAVPLEKLLLETDAPFLTPAPYRGSICEPRYVRVTAEFLARIRGEEVENLSVCTTANAKRIFNLR